jgi:hypothetical protein
MTAFEFLKTIRYLPMSVERPCSKASNSEIKRWLRKKSVLINGLLPDVNDVIKFPVFQLVFFPKGKRKCTMC